MIVTYIALLSFTEKGIAGVKETTRRAAAAQDGARSFGVKLRDVCWTMGECDLVCVVEGDCEESVAAFDLALAMQGNVRSRSMRAFTAQEMERVIGKLG